METHFYTFSGVFLTLLLYLLRNIMKIKPRSVCTVIFLPLYFNFDFRINMLYLVIAKYLPKIIKIKD